MRAVATPTSNSGAPALLPDTHQGSIPGPAPAGSRGHQRPLVTESGGLQTRLGRWRGSWETAGASKWRVTGDTGHTNKSDRGVTPHVSRCEAAAVRPGSGWQGWSLGSPSSELTQELGGLDWLPGVGAQPPRALGVQDAPGALTPSCSPTVLPPWPPRLRTPCPCRHPQGSPVHHLHLGRESPNERLLFQDGL